MRFLPGDQVVWFRALRGSTLRYQKIPAEVFYRAKSKIAIRIMGKEGKREIRYVFEEQLQAVV